MTVVSSNANTGGVKFVAPDGGWGWVVVLSSFVIHMIMDGITYSLGTYVTLFVDEFKVSHAEVGMLHSILPAVTLSCGPIASVLTNRFGCRNTTIVGSIIAAFGFLISFFVVRFHFLYITVGAITGLGFGIIYVPAIVSVGYYFEKKRSFAIGIAVCGAGVGTLVLSPLNQLLSEHYGWEGAFLIKAGFVLNCCVCGAVMRPVPIEQSEIRKREKLLKQKKNTHVQTSLIEKQILIENKSLSPQSAVVPEMNISCKDLYPNIPKIDASNYSMYETQSVKNELAGVTKSLPSLNNNRVETNELKVRVPSINKSINSKMKLNASMKSSLDIMAHTRSSSNIKINATIQSEKQMDAAKKPGTLKLFTNVLFLHFAVSNFLTSLGFNAPYIYITDQAMSMGIESSKAAFLLSTIGISNTVGRVVLGLLADLKGCNRLFLYSTVLTICGIATMLNPFATNYAGLTVYAVAFGFMSGGYVSITSILLVDLLGLEQLTNAFGILLVFQGVATLIGPPTVGLMYDAFKSYTFPYLFTGSMIAISGFMCYFIPCWSSYKKPEVVEEDDE